MSVKLKTAMRVAHLFSSMIISTQIVLNYISADALSNKLSKRAEYWQLNAVCSVTCFISGLALVYLEKNGKTLEDPVQAAWQHMFEFKFVLTLLMTPLIYPLTSLFAEN